MRMCKITFSPRYCEPICTVSVTYVENDHFMCMLKEPFYKPCLIEVDNLSGHADFREQ